MVTKKRSIAWKATWAARPTDDDYSVGRGHARRPGDHPRPQGRSRGVTSGRNVTGGSQHRPNRRSAWWARRSRHARVSSVRSLLFEQGGDPKWCWCAYFRIRGFDFSSGGKARHRAGDGDRRSTRPRSEGRAPGLVAYDGDEAVGWISIGPREDYERLAHSTVLKPIDDKPVWSIVCFVVGRRSAAAASPGAARTAGIDYARDHGATMLEAYPVEVADGERIAVGGRLPRHVWRCSNGARVSRSSTAVTTPGGPPVAPIVRRGDSAARHGDSQARRPTSSVVGTPSSSVHVDTDWPRARRLPAGPGAPDHPFPLTEAARNMSMTHLLRRSIAPTGAVDGGRSAPISS